MSVHSILAKALGLPESTSADDMVNKLADAMAPQEGSSTSAVSHSEDPQERFHSLAERLSKAAGISLGDAYSLASREAPEYYINVRNAADLNRVML